MAQSWLRLITLILLPLGMWWGGCAAPSAPVAPAPDSTPQLIKTAFHEGECIPAVFDLTVDAATLSAELTPQRGATGFQATQYELDPTRFLKPETLEIEALSRTADGDVEVTFTHAHPWPAPDLTQPPSATNRADLGYTGRLLILADLAASEVAEHTFFGGEVRAQTAVVRHADGYVNPGDLLNEGGFLANAFPYMLVVDEEKDNRIGISNGGNPAGNYFALGQGGWQRSTLGLAGTAWTGFDYQHAGQAVRNSFLLRRQALRDGPYHLRLALLVKYTEPKARREVALRLPPTTTDPLEFAYRLSSSAVDVSQATLSPDLFVFDSAGATTATLSVSVRDWDASALESANPDLSQETLTNRNTPGARGLPTAMLDCPGLLPAPVELPRLIGPPQGSGTNGYANWRIPFGIDLTNSGKVPGLLELVGLIRVADVTLDDPVPEPRYGRDPLTLVPDVARALTPVTYQAFRVRIMPRLPQWTKVSIDPVWDMGSQSDVVVLNKGDGDPANDRVAVAYRDTVNWQLKVALAQIRMPVSAVDWKIMVVDLDVIDSPARVTDYFGRLVVLYAGENGFVRELRIAASTGIDPTTSADWQTQVLASPIGKGAGSGDYFACSLGSDVTGRLVAAWPTRLAGPDEIRVTRALTAAPWDPADWATHTVVSLGTIPREHSWRVAVDQVVYRDALFLAFYSQGPPAGIYVARALMAAPAQTADWEVRPAARAQVYPVPLFVGQPRLAVVEGDRLLLTYHNGSVQLCLTASPAPQSPLDWQCDTMIATGGAAHARGSLHGGAPRLLFHGGNPAYPISLGRRLSPSGDPDPIWQTAIIDYTTSGSFGVTEWDGTTVATYQSKVDHTLYMVYTTEEW